MESTLEIGAYRMRYVRLGTQLVIVGALVLLAAPVMLVVRRVQRIVEGIV